MHLSFSLVSGETRTPGIKCDISSDPLSFWYPHAFWKFDYPPVNYDLENSKEKRHSHDTDHEPTIEQA